MSSEADIRAGTVVVLGTGGTIAGRAASTADNIGYTAGVVTVDELLSAVPGLSGSGPVWSEQLAQLDSKDMNFELWRQLATRVDQLLQRDEVCAVVVTHGTDTLEETAFFLSRVCRSVKPVVLTCAMRPASALMPDGPQNILDAVSVARWPGATGVMVCCAGRIHAAAEVQKIHSYRLDAFDSGDAGPIGLIVEGQLKLMRNWPVAHTDRAHTAIKNIANVLPSNWPRVEIVLNYAGASGAIVEALVAQGVRGLVAAATGNGTLHRDLEEALRTAQAAGVQVVRATRCSGGGIVSRPDDQFESAGNLTPVKARIEMMLELMASDEIGHA